MVHAVPENWTVGIVHPIFCGEQMELRAKGIGREALLQSSLLKNANEWKSSQPELSPEERPAACSQIRAAKHHTCLRAKSD